MLVFAYVHILEITDALRIRSRRFAGTMADVRVRPVLASIRRNLDDRNSASRQDIGRDTRSWHGLVISRQIALLWARAEISY